MVTSHITGRISGTWATSLMLHNRGRGHFRFWNGRDAIQDGGGKRKCPLPLLWSIKLVAYTTWDPLSSWWRHQMETFSALLAIYAGNSPVPGEFPTQRPMTRSFDVYFDLHLNKQLSKQSQGWWFETPSGSLWRQCNANIYELKSRHGYVITCPMKCRSEIIYPFSNFSGYTGDVWERISNFIPHFITDWSIMLGLKLNHVSKRGPLDLKPGTVI